MMVSSSNVSNGQYQASEAQWLQWS